MRKFLLAALASLSITSPMLAGGYLTNTNQSVHFLRNPARDGAIGIDGAYFNPAGVGFLSEGWHLGFDVQSAYQTRRVSALFGDAAVPPFALGTVNGQHNAVSGEKTFRGKAKAPVIPSLDLARVGEHWFATFHFGITGGGGICAFDGGLPSFESQEAMLPALIGAIAPGSVTGYSMDTHVQGRQYYFGGQFGAGYRINPKLNVSIGGRVVYANCNYYGYVRDIGVDVATPMGSVSMPAAQFLENQGLPHFSGHVADKELNCVQYVWVCTPILGIDYKSGRWNIAAKYEFKTRLRLKNRSGVNTSGLEEFDDGKTIAADIPALLTLGAQYEITNGLRANAGFHYYFDIQASQFNHREDYLDKVGWEVLACMEYDIDRRWTVSAGWQSTNYGLGRNSRFISDMSFVTNSNSVGLGAAFRIREKVRLNVAYFKTFYKHYPKRVDDYNNLKGTFSNMLEPLSAQLQSAAQQYAAVIANPGSTEADKIIANQQLSIVTGELGALSAASSGLSTYNTGGGESFHRTNDVFGIGLEVDF